MRLTVDSNDPLADVLAVLGSMYGVRLQVAQDEPAADDAADGGGAEAPSRPELVGAGEQARGRRRGRPQGGRRAAAAEAPARTSARARRGDEVDSRAVRAWARENGHDVSTRGRLSSSLVAAYREANG